MLLIIFFIMNNEDLFQHLIYYMLLFSQPFMILLYFPQNGGLYVKLGQGLVSMNHILPKEYLETLKVSYFDWAQMGRVNFVLFSYLTIRVCKWKMWVEGHILTIYLTFHSLPSLSPPLPFLCLYSFESVGK